MIMAENVFFAVTLVFLGAVFLIFAVLFAVRKEKACQLIAGFNSMTERQQLQYDQKAIARDYGRLFAAWTIGAFFFAGLCLIWGWIPFGAAFALLIATTVPHMHLWAENAFKKYKIVKKSEG